MKELAESECRALSIAVDELRSYVETVGDADPATPKIRWAIAKLDDVLVRNGHADWVSMS